jgi:hypothetical protein
MQVRGCLARNQKKSRLDDEVSGAKALKTGVRKKSLIERKPAFLFQ